MRKWLLLILAAGGLHAAILRGIVVENQTGLPLARTLVMVRPVAGTSGASQSVRTNTYGSFEFTGLPGGTYIVIASRRSFATVQYGQKNWKAVGLPVILEEPQSQFLNIRLPHFGAIAGRLVDENGVGLPEHDVIAYRNTRPPVIAGRAVTDDRGMYRIFGLEPGTYLVRTLAKLYEEGGYLPTFYRDVAAVDQARPVDVDLDRQTDDVTVRPTPGVLLRVGGTVSSLNVPPAPATLTLVSDMGSETVTSDGEGHFQFNPQAPGKYELYGSAPGDRTAAYLPFELEKDQTILRIGPQSLPRVQFVFEDTDGHAMDASAIQVLGRRKDLSGDGKPETLRLTSGRVQLAPGRWDFAVAFSSVFYAASFLGPGQQPAPNARADGWNEGVIATGRVAVVKFRISSKPGSLHGTVTAAGHDPAAAAPVYLESYDTETRKRLADVRIVWTGTTGQYQFDGLAPGAYRVLSTFEYQSPDAAAMDAARAVIVKAEEGRTVQQDLDLYVIR